MFGGSTPHAEKAEVGMLSPAVLEEWLIQWGQPPESYTSWTHAAVLGVWTVLLTMPHTSLWRTRWVTGCSKRLSRWSRSHHGESKRGRRWGRSSDPWWTRSTPIWVNVCPCQGEGRGCEVTVQHEYSKPTKRAISSESRNSMCNESGLLWLIAIPHHPTHTNSHYTPSLSTDATTCGDRAGLVHSSQVALGSMPSPWCGGNQPWGGGG